MTRIWSPQQEAFLNWAAVGDGSCVLEAVAGAGKTTVLVAAARLFRGSCVYLAFGKKAGAELNDRLKAEGHDWKKAEGGTCHSFGWRGVRKLFKGIKIAGMDGVPKKVATIIDDMLIERPFAAAIEQLVSLAKQRALGVGELRINDRTQWMDLIEHFDILDMIDGEVRGEDVEYIIRKAWAVLEESNRRTDTADFDDMVYLPLIYPSCPIWQYDNVVLDEAQDTNRARRLLARRLLKRGGRFVGVGDPCQAIFGFTGADNDSLDQLVREFGCVRMPLSVSYRCPQAVVSFVRRWVSHIEAHPSAPVGEVADVSAEDFFAGHVEGLKNGLGASSAILCRNTKPIVALAFQIIRSRVPCRVEGRDLGVGLKKLATRWKRPKTLQALDSQLADYLDKEIEKLLAKKREDKVQAITDKVETLRVMIDQCLQEGKTQLEDLYAVIDSLFGDNVTGMLTLSTIHKSKGREWNTVYWLDRAGTCPSKWAKKPWEQKQEIHLMYVAGTRAKSALYELPDLSTAKPAAQPAAILSVAEAA
jgi:DNA helicase-2/ATP-dependent DNA helicase PcrA